MLFKRPHTLKYIIVESTGNYQDENGDWHPGTTTETEIEVKCKSEPNGQGDTIKSTDGQNIVFNRIVYLDSKIQDIELNTQVSILLNRKVIASGTVKLFERYQKHCNIWI